MSFPAYGVDYDQGTAIVDHAVDRLNHRPRKTLDYRTPHEAYYGTAESLTVALGS
ncbi:hypothetical protein KGY79_13735 [Candidatus Bipolaricaulota bacterium]|nr:hypothetical protein [Candidatus Bipolaricaulota bacterium]